MNYNLLICSSTKGWTAIDINEDGNCDRISFDGNETMEVDSEETVEAFCAQILNYYNIDNYDDIELNIKVVLISEYSKLITALFRNMNVAKSLNIIDAKSIIPIYVLKNCIVKPGGVIDVRCMDEKFTLQVDDTLVVSYIPHKAGEEIIMEPECFSILFNFDCKNLISDESELKALESKCASEVKKEQKKVAEQKKQYFELKKKYDNLESSYNELKNKVEKSKFDDKRVIHYFTTDQLKETSTNVSYVSEYYAGVIGSILSSSPREKKKKYTCKVLKADGEIVKKNDSLLEIIESHSINGSEFCESGKKCVIKANKDGRIFYLVKNNDSIKDNEAVVMESDPADKRSEIMKWYKEMK